MYFPYLRGRQYELLALRELVNEGLLGDFVIPIIEPVKSTPTLLKTINTFKDKKRQVALIGNPSVGSFIQDCRTSTDKNCFGTLYDGPSVIKSIIMNSDAQDLLTRWNKNGTSKEELLVINTDRDYLDLFDKQFSETTPKYTLIPDESIFRRKVKRNRIILDDKFKKQNRNADYGREPDEFFSDDHLFLKEDGLSGFSDYSVIGSDFQESGFAPYAVAIHIVYFADNQSLRIHHFVSDSNDDILNPAKKFYEAIKELKLWVDNKSVPRTRGLSTLLQHYEEETYPGLGSVKKLSVMHHLELMEKYLSGRR